MPRRSFVGLVASLFIAASPASRADMITQMESIGPKSSSFTSTFVFNKFDPGLGTLRAVDFLLTTSLLGQASYENTSNAIVNNIALTLQASIAVDRPDGSLLATATPSTTVKATNVAAFDNKTDFMGASGHTYVIDPTPPLSDLLSSHSASDLGLFSGFGTIRLPINSVGQSFATGPGNVAIRFATSATATVTVSYLYDGVHSVPEPSSLALIACGGLGLVAVAGRRRRIASPTS